MQKEMFVTDLFKEYCQYRHEEDKISTNNANYNYMQDIFATTELFDISLLSDEKETKKVHLEVETKDKRELVIHDDSFKNITLPFSNNFVKGQVYNGTYLSVFIREYNPTTITGAIWLKCSSNNSLEILNRSTISFYIDTENGTFTIDSTFFKLLDLKFSKNTDTFSDIMEGIIKKTIQSTLFTIDKICNLPKHKVLADTPRATIYYPKKKSAGIRVSNRPIYYILSSNEKESRKQEKTIRPIGHLEYTHSFKVRGHWRRINQHSIGKNRNGEYKVYGFTFVKEYVKGEGELEKRVRVLKS